MASEWWSDDDQLVASLKEAEQAARVVPPDFVEMGKAAYTWLNIDAELAALTYDSAVDDASVPAATRADSTADPALLRALTYASAELTIELEVTPDALLGQIVPPQAGQLEIRSARQTVTTASIDEMGWFVVSPLPSGAFRLRCQTVTGLNVITDWLTL